MRFKYRDIEKRPIKTDYRIVRQKDSPVIFSDGKNILPAPNHGAKDISPGVERQLLKILGISVSEFRNIR